LREIRFAALPSVFRGPVNETFGLSQTIWSRPALSESRANAENADITNGWLFGGAARRRQKGSVDHVCPADFS
jgi:hypothetical protein